MEARIVSTSSRVKPRLACSLAEDLMFSTCLGHTITLSTPPDSV